MKQKTAKHLPAPKARLWIVLQDISVRIRNAVHEPLPHEKHTSFDGRVRDRLSYKPISLFQIVANLVDQTRQWKVTLLHESRNHCICGTTLTEVDMHFLILDLLKVSKQSVKLRLKGFNLSFFLMDAHIFKQEGNPLPLSGILGATLTIWFWIIPTSFKLNVDYHFVCHFNALSRLHWHPVRRKLKQTNKNPNP